MERFWSKVDRRGPDECWPWLGCRDPKGYGRFKLEGRSVPSNRVALALKLGRAVREDCDACHTCDNPACCNTEHLYEGTPQDNSNDRVVRGRSQRGEEHSQAKLTRARLAELCNLWATGEYTQDELGARFGISRSAVSMNVRGKRWK
jgi:hypothetical protein